MNQLILLTVALLFLTSCASMHEAAIIPKPVAFYKDQSGAVFESGDTIAKLIYPADSELGDEGYKLNVSKNQVVIEANTRAGLFYGEQTVKQALMQGGLSAGVIRDYPRFKWRGAMLDIARHFFRTSDIIRYIDLLALYKINRLHLHLSDDQGWRIEIKSWPKLTEIGASTQVGGGKGGFLSQEEYRYIVAYAKERFITIIPEIDMPGHINAALASYPELNCGDQMPQLYTGTKVGFSSLCINKDVTYQFVDDVIRELASLTPGPYIHIGGDEAKVTTKDEYAAFIPRVEQIVRKYGKSMIGWEEIRSLPLAPDSVSQIWLPKKYRQSLTVAPQNQKGAVINSIANRLYIDMKYEKKMSFGHDWATFLTSETGYDWDPAEGFVDEIMLGVEAPLWTETVTNISEIETMAFPRVMGVAEVAWTPQSQRSWKDYRKRAAKHKTILQELKVSYYPDPSIPWEESR